MGRYALLAVLASAVMNARNAFLATSVLSAVLGTSILYPARRLGLGPSLTAVISVRPWGFWPTF